MRGKIRDSVNQGGKGICSTEKILVTERVGEEEWEWMAVTCHSMEWMVPHRKCGRGWWRQGYAHRSCFDSPWLLQLWNIWINWVERLSILNCKTVSEWENSILKLYPEKKPKHLPCRNVSQKQILGQQNSFLYNNYG